MNLMRPEECRLWCSKNEIHVSPDGKPSFLSIGRSNCFSIKIPKEGRSRAALNIALFGTEVDRSIKFNGGLFWAHLWDIGSQDLDDVGDVTIRMLMNSVDPGASLNSHPGVVFKDSECDALRVFSTISMIYEWDYSIIDMSGEYMMFSSHDSILYIISRLETYKEKIFAEYRKYWKVADHDCPIYMKS